MASVGAKRLQVLCHQFVSSVNSQAGVEAEITYASEDGQVPGGAKRSCFITDGRSMGHSLDHDGFELSTVPPKGLASIDVYDIAQCSDGLYPIVADVLKKSFPSSTKVIVFDHILRNATRFAQEANGANKTPMLVGGVADRVHGDYTVRSGFMRARQLLSPHETPERVDAALQQRFAFINVWVPLKEVLRDPLAMLEWSTTRPRDVVTMKMIFKHRQGELYRVVPSDLHRWVYYPHMTPGECLLFKVFDSKEDGCARFCLHTAFSDPTCPTSAPPRESIELRCIAFFGDLPTDFAQSFVAPHLVPGPDQDLTDTATAIAGEISDEL